MKTDTIEWHQTTAVNYGSTGADNGYTIYHNLQRNDYWPWYGDATHRTTTICNPFETLDGAKEAVTRHYHDEANTAIWSGANRYKGWHFPHPRWVGSSPGTEKWEAIIELDGAIETVCELTTRVQPRGYDFEQHRDAWAESEVVGLLNSLGSSDENECHRANQGLTHVASRCLAEWDAKLVAVRRPLAGDSGVGQR